MTVSKSDSPDQIIKIKTKENKTRQYAGKEKEIQQSWGLPFYNPSC